MTCVSKGLIVGGGIAGLSAAIGLARTGVSCDVVEMGEAPLGAGMTLSGGVIQALDSLDVYDTVARTAAPLSKAMYAPVMRDFEGLPMGPPPNRPEAPNAKPSIRVYRPAFVSTLERSADSLGVHVQRGVTVAAIKDRIDSVAVTLSDGAERRYDFVIGADGVGSRVRGLLFPDSPAPTYAGQMCIHWLIPGPAIQGEGWYVGRNGGRLGFFHMPHQQAIYAPMVITMAERRVAQQDAYAIAKHLLDTFTAPAIVKLRQHLTPLSNLICRPFHTILMPSPWYRGRTLLIGDAAHATTAHIGQGGGMAVEDAVVIAECIATATTLSEAYEAFMRRRFARVRVVVDTSVALSKLEQEGATGLDPALMSFAYRILAQPY